MMNAIAERAERIESEFWRQMVERLDASSRAQLGIKALKVAGGTTLMAPGADVASINRTISLGVRRKLETAVVREVSALYCKAGVERWMVEWCPLGTPDTGYREIAECGGEAKTPTVKFYADLVRVPR